MESQEDNAHENELKPPVKKQKIVAIDGNNLKCLPSNGPVVSTLHTLLQWEARIPSLNETEQKLTLAAVLNGANQETVEFQTDDKICIGLYVPTGSSIDGYRLLKNGTILEVTVLTHKLMWEPNGIHLSLQESTEIQDGYDSNRMRARKRFLSEAIKANIMMDGNAVPNEHKFEIALKKRVSTNESDTIHFCHTFECSSQNQEQLFFAYFEMTIVKPKVGFLSPKKVESQVNRMDTSTGRTNHGGSNKSNSHGSSNPAGGSSHSSSSSSRSNSTNTQHSSRNPGQNYCSSSNTTPVNPDLKRLEIENNDLKKKVSSFDIEKQRLIEDFERETNNWMERQQKDLQHREDQMVHNMNVQIKQHEALASEKLKHEVLIQQKANREELEKNFERKLFEQKKSHDEALKALKYEREAAEVQLIDQKEQSHRLENENYEMQEKLSSLENDVKKSIAEGQMVLALSSPSPLSNATFHIDNQAESRGKKRKTNLTQSKKAFADHSSPASAVIEHD